MKSSGIGGQAVIEGVMMKNKDVYAVAVRKPGNEIAIEKNTHDSISDKYKILKLPILRGVLSFIESMAIGMKTLTFSASFYEEEEVKPGKVETTFNKIFKDNAEKVVMALTVLLSIVMAVGIFMILPFFLSEFFKNHVTSQVTLAIIEGALRILLFIAYVVAISQMKDIKRVFQYHGAEHKTINCIEHGYELTVENVRHQSREHKRCGTSFMLIVMFFSIIFFLFIKTDTLWLRILIRLLLVPVIAGVSYEFIQLAGRSDSKVMEILSKPGLWLQGLTTREPEDDMIEVAIQSVEAVFDWRGYLEEEKKTLEQDKESKVKSLETKGLASKTRRKASKAKKNSSKYEKEVLELENENKVAESEFESLEVKMKTSKTNSKVSKGKKDISAYKKDTSRIEEKSLREDKKKAIEEYSITLDPNQIDEDEDKDDEILRALDRYFIEHRSDGRKK